MMVEEEVVMEKVEEETKQHTLTGKFPSSQGYHALPVVLPNNAVLCGI